jgi:hypothetical protein
MLTKEKGTIKTYASSKSGNFMRNAEASSSKDERNFTKNSEAGKKISPLDNNNTSKRKRRKQRPKQYNDLNEMDEHLKEALRVSEIFIALLSFIPLCFKNLLNIIFSGTSFGT